MRTTKALRRIHSDFSCEWPECEEQISDGAFQQVEGQPAVAVVVAVAVAVAWVVAALGSVQRLPSSALLVCPPPPPPDRACPSCSGVWISLALLGGFICMCGRHVW